MFVLLCLMATEAQGRRTAAEYELKAAFVFNVAKFVTWPGAAFTDAAQPFGICVLGEDPFGTAFAPFLAKKVGRRGVVLRHIRRGENADGCQMLFIAASESSRVPKILKRLRSAPVLTVSDTHDFAKRGGMVGLLRKGRKIVIQVNPGAVERAGIRMSSKLLALAEILEEDK